MHTTAEAIAMAAPSSGKGKGIGCRVRWYIQGPVSIKGNVLQDGFAMYNTRRKYSGLGKINL